MKLYHSVKQYVVHQKGTVHLWQDCALLRNEATHEGNVHEYDNMVNAGMIPRSVKWCNICKTTTTGRTVNGRLRCLQLDHLDERVDWATIFKVRDTSLQFDESAGNRTVLPLDMLDARNLFIAPKFGERLHLSTQCRGLQTAQQIQRREWCAACVRRLLTSNDQP